MRLAIDALAIVGGILLCAGVYLVLGTGCALIMAGCLLIGLSLKAANVYEGSNAADS